MWESRLRGGAYAYPVLTRSYFWPRLQVHDPDEYLSAAKDKADLEQRRKDVLGAYKGLMELRDAGKVQSIGVWAKDITARLAFSTNLVPA